MYICMHVLISKHFLISFLVFPPLAKGYKTFLPTFKQRADFPPAGDASLAGVLAKSRFQEKNRNATGEQEDHVRDEECT